MKTFFFLCLVIIGVFGDIDWSKFRRDVPSTVGVNIHFTSPQVNEMKMISEGGWGWVRTDFTWQAVEKSPGVYDFSKYDTLVSSLDAVGMRALFIFDYGNPLYDKGNAPNTDVGRKAFTNFTLAAMHRYQGKEYIWELWNEPNLSYSWKPQPNVTAYSLLAVTVGKAVKAAFPNEVFVGAGVSKFDWPYLNDLYGKSDVLKYFDAVSIHGYGNSPPEEWISNESKLQKLIDQNKPANKEIPILCSEWGHSLLDNPPSPLGKISPDEQASLLVRDYLVTLGTGSIATIWYDWRDDCTDSTDKECFSGTVQYHYSNSYPPYKPNPAYNAAKTFTQQLKGTSFDKVVLKADTKYVYKFNNPSNSDFVLVAWTSGSSSSVSIPLESDSCFKVFDLYGSSQGRVCSKNKSLDKSVTDSPIYLVSSS